MYVCVVNARANLDFLSFPCLWLVKNGGVAAVGGLDLCNKLSQPFKKPWVEK